MIQVSFASGSYTPVSVVNFAPTAVQVLACAGYGTLDDVSGTANGTVINAGYTIYCDFSPSNYTPLPLAIFGNPGDLSGAGYGVLDDLSGLADCISTSYQPAIAYGVLDDLSGVADCKSIVNIGVAYGVLDDLAGVAQCHYDSNVPRHLICKVTADLQDGDSLSLIVNANQQATNRHSLHIEATAEAAQSVTVEISSEINKTILQSVKTCVKSEQAQAVSITLNSPINLTRLLSSFIADNKQDAQALAYSLQSLQDVLIFTITQTEARIEDCRNHIIRVLTPRYLPLVDYLPLPEAVFAESDYTPQPVVAFDSSIRVDYLIETTHGALSIQVITPAGKSQFIHKKTCVLLESGRYPPPGKSLKIAGEHPPPTPQPTNHQTVIIPIRESYAMQHTIIVKTVADNQAIELSKISLSYDVESYAWQFSGTLANKADLNRFNLNDFEPIQLSITINGYQWLVLVEEIPEKKSFGKTDIQLTGRSIAALLGEPWSQINSYLQGSDMTVQQIADSLCPFDWTIDWQCPTWLVPANNFSFTQQSPIQALKTIANYIGAVLYPVPGSKTLRMQPRYPVLPWNYNLAGITPDLVIPDAAIESISLKSRTTSPINGVYVHGATATGILARCVLSGTAGDVLAPTESNPLITDVTGARALAERHLAGKYTQPGVASVTTFLGGDFPLAGVGALVSVNNEKATVSGVSIDVEFGKVRQVLSFGENSSNLYAKLIGMLPKSPLLVGTVVSVYEDNAIVSLIGGGVITARGTGVVGQNYYVRNGVIETQAPNLTTVEVVV